MENKKNTNSFDNNNIDKNIKTIRSEQEKRYQMAKQAASSVLNQKIDNAYNNTMNAILNCDIVTSTTIGNKPTIVINDNTNTVSIDSPLTIQGRDVLKELDEMRDALLLLKRDIDMEAKYPRLRELKDEYEAAVEKYKTFERLK